MPLTTCKLKVKNLAKPDGSFHWDFSGSKLEASSEKILPHVLYVNSTAINVTDDEFLCELFSNEVLEKLDGIAIRNLSSSHLHVIFPHLARLPAHQLTSLKPFNLDCHHVCLESKHDYARFMSIVASLLRQNRIVSLVLPDRVYSCFEAKAGDAVAEAEIDVVNAIHVTKSLLSLDWCRAMCIGHSDEQRVRMGRRHQLQQPLLAAFNSNVSLTEVSVYCGHASKHEGFDDIIKPLLSRNKDLPSMNSGLAAGYVGGRWDGSCPADLVKQFVTAKLNINSSLLNTSYDRCRCKNCYGAQDSEPACTHGTPPSRYACAIGWVRIGLKIPKGHANMNDILKKWHKSYHGTTTNNVASIIHSGLRLPPPNGTVTQGSLSDPRSDPTRPVVRRTNFYTGTDELFDLNQIFTSPSIRYASHPAYTRQFVNEHPQRAGVLVGFRCVFQCRQRPGSYMIGQDTVGAQGVKLDPCFNNNELEWYTKDPAEIVISGLCVQVRYLS